MNGVLGHVANRPVPIAELDYAVVSLAALLLGIGLVMVYSSSIAIAEASHYTGNQPAYFLIRHSVFVFVGVMAGVICFQFPTRLWQQAAPYLFVLGVAAAVGGVDSRHWQGGQRQPALALAGIVQPAALRTDETAGGVVRR